MKLNYPCGDQQQLKPCDKNTVDNDITTIANSKDYKEFDDQEENRNVINNSDQIRSRVETINKLNTVTTVPQLQQKLNTCIIKSNTRTATSMKNHTTPIKPLSDGIATPFHSQTALTKFNQIIDESISSSSASTSSQTVYPSILSDSLKSRLATLYPSFITDKSNLNSKSPSKNIINDKIDKTIVVGVDFVSTSNNPKRNDVNFMLDQMNSSSTKDKTTVVDETSQQCNQTFSFSQYGEGDSRPYNIQDRCQLESFSQHQLHKNQYDNDISVLSKSEPVVSASQKLHSSPTTTSLVLYSASAQKRKGIRRYASLHQANDFLQPEIRPYQYIKDHYYLHHQQQQNHQYVTPCRSCIAHIANMAMLQQFVDDYMFQSCHYLEMNNFTSNYNTAMVESTSHEFRPSITTTTNTSEGDDGINYEKPSLNRSFDYNEVKVSNISTKAQTPYLTNVLCGKKHLKEKTTRSSGIQTDFDSLSLSHSNTGNSSLSSTSKSKLLFKCCYTPIDKWRKKHSNQNKHPSFKKSLNNKNQKSATCLDATTNIAFVDVGGKRLEPTITMVNNANAIEVVTKSGPFGKSKNRGHPV